MKLTGAAGLGESVITGQGEVQLSFLPSLGISVLLMSLSFLFILYHKIYSIGRRWGYVIEKKNSVLKAFLLISDPEKFMSLNMQKKCPMKCTARAW